jgi:hypothetical protein
MMIFSTNRHFGQAVIGQRGSDWDAMVGGMEEASATIFRIIIGHLSVAIV